jgi:hypothetical protein
MKKSELKKYIRENIISTLSENIEDETKALDDYESKLDDVIKKKQEAGIEEKVAKTVDDVIDPADYSLIGSGYLSGFNRPHSLDADELETLGRKIVKQLYKGDFDKAKAKFIKEDEDKEPSDSEIKKNKSLAKAVEELARLTQEMKSLAKKYSKANGQEKEDLLNKLKAKTKIKKELENILDKKM